MISECNLSEGKQHFWIPVTRMHPSAVQYYSCPMCDQVIFYSQIYDSWMLAEGKK